MNDFDLTVLWNALVAIANEQARSLQRSAFSPIVREAGDLASSIFDRSGRMVAQAVTGTPGHHNSLARAVQPILERYPIDELADGDALVVNDPFRTSGQLLDISVIRPVWRGGTIVAYVASTAHHTDIGGYGMGPGARDVHEEGLWIPPLKLMTGGRRNQDVWDLVLANSRTPKLLEGDLHAQVAAGELGARKLEALCSSRNLTDLDDVAERIITRSEEVVRRTVVELAPATGTGSASLDLPNGVEVEIVTTVTLDDETGDIVVDYRGSSPASPVGINVAWNYTFSYTAFILRSILNPSVPNNHGSLAPIKLLTERGSIVDARPPSPVNARHLVGMLVPMPILRALADVVPDRVVAEGSGPIWSVEARGTNERGEQFVSSSIDATGGMGARAGKAGLDTIGFPTGLSTSPIEIIEREAPIRFLRKEIRAGSGGRGRYPGGNGQIVEFTVESTGPWLLNATVGRISHAPQGLFGGEPGAKGEFLIDGCPVTDVKALELPPGAVVHMALPGGGGYGAPGGERR